MKQRNIFPKVIKLFLAIILVIFIYFSIYTFIQKKQNLKKPEFITTTRTKGNLMKQIVAVGNLKPVSEIEVGSQISGKIKKKSDGSRIQFGKRKKQYRQ